MMAYIDYSFYADVFGGREIPVSDFSAIADAATELCSGLCHGALPPDDDAVKRAVAHETEFLYCQGGRDAVAGLSFSGGLSEKLGDYAVGISSYGNGQRQIPMADGIPISAMALMILRRKGLMSRVVPRSGVAEYGG